MIEKDPIEDLFRSEANNAVSEVKPRDVVWQKIERELKSKHQHPLQLFINNIWSSAAVFALIAIPYFYFLIENLEHEHYQKLVIKENKDYFKNEPFLLHDSVANIKRYTTDSVSNQPKIAIVTQKKEQINNRNHQNILTKEKDSILKLNDSTLEIASIILDEINLNDLDSTQVIAFTEANVTPSDFRAKLSMKSEKGSDTILYYRNRIVLNEKVNRVSFYFIENTANKLTFKHNKSEIYIYKVDDLIKVSVNTNTIKKEILDLVIKNKEAIFNYYINLSAIKS